MHLWQASLLSAAVHAGILALPAREPPARQERKKPREVQLVKLPPPEAPAAQKAVASPSHRRGTTGEDRPEALRDGAGPRHRPPEARSERPPATVAKSAPPPAHARPVKAVRKPEKAQRHTPPATRTRVLSDSSGATVLARLTRIDRSESPKEAPPAPHLEAGLDFTLGLPVPLREADPGAVRPGRPGEGVFGVGGDVGTVTVTVGDGGGDVSPRLLLIQKRIDSVVAMLRTARKDCPGTKGFVRIEFQIQKNGYPAYKRLRASSGDPCLEDKAGAVIHLAEPYPYVSGWVPVTMDFN